MGGPEFHLDNIRWVFAYGNSHTPFLINESELHDICSFIVTIPIWVVVRGVFDGTLEVLGVNRLSPYLHTQTLLFLA